MPDSVCFYAIQSSNIHSQWIKTNFASSKCYLHFSGVLNRFCRLFTCRKLQVFFLFSKLLSYSQCFEWMYACGCARFQRAHTRSCTLHFFFSYFSFLICLFAFLLIFRIILSFSISSLFRLLTILSHELKITVGDTVYVVCPNILESLALNSPLFNRYEWCA